MCLFSRVLVLEVLKGNPQRKSATWLWVKPCTPGEHQNRWQMDVHPPQNGATGYATHGHLGGPTKRDTPGCLFQRFLEQLLPTLLGFSSHLCQLFLAAGHLLGLVSLRLLQLPFLCPSDPLVADCVSGLNTEATKSPKQAKRLRDGWEPPRLVVTLGLLLLKDLRAQPILELFKGLAHHHHGRLLEVRQAEPLQHLCAFLCHEVASHLHDHVVSGDGGGNGIDHLLKAQVLWRLQSKKCVCVCVCVCVKLVLQGTDAVAEGRLVQ